MVFGKKKEKLSAPTREDYSNASVVGKVMSEATQHPTTLIPAAIAILAGAYMGLVSFDATSFAVAVGSGIASVLSWVYHFFVRGEDIGKNYVKELNKRRMHQKEKQGEDIEVQFILEGFKEGELAAKELKQAFSRLAQFLKDKIDKNQAGGSQRFLALAEDSYNQGMTFLNKALSLYKALNAMNAPKLKRELKAWEKEIAKLNQESGDNEHTKLVIQALDQRIQSHKRRLELFDERTETLKQIMAQCEILEATLDSTYLEVVDLMEGDHHIQQDNAAGNLERAISAARRVEDRLRGIEQGPDFDDSIYDPKNRNNNE
jgi:hypothetical protein